MRKGFLWDKKENPKLTYGQFLELDGSDPKFTNTKSQRTSFCNFLKRYRDGTLKQALVKCMKARKFALVEEKLVN